MEKKRVMLLIVVIVFIASVWIVPEAFFNYLWAAFSLFNIAYSYFEYKQDANNNPKLLIFLWFIVFAVCVYKIIISLI
ncbi:MULTISPECIES: hypothetical protein [unclassified Breznakia]|uniref:hypothetical protein n=1 Tax=unclassified Breznakia TaxID=2623764 RepID=UPI002404FA95|nr:MULTISPECIES: hypothetical protein [unclassified Breznakia]